MSKAKPWEAEWKIDGPLDGGGQGTTRLVSAVADPARRGVLKTLKRGRSPQARGRMRIEVVSLDVLAKLGCKVPHVLAHNVDRADDLDVELFFVMEYIPGKKLSDALRERGRLPLEKAVAVTLDLCATVRAAHKENILHRDLKPDNIIVRDLDKDDLVIVDFGLSFNHDEADENLTDTGEQMRNRLLALPETNVEGGDRRDKRSDVTALAAVFCYCLTKHVPGQLPDGNGRPPHRRPGFSVREALRNDPRSEAVERLLDRAFMLEVENRFQSVEELESRLRTVLVATSREDEDPVQVAAELAKDLRQRDRKTWLAAHQPHAHQVLHEACQKALMATAPQCHPFTLSLGNGWPGEKPVPTGADLISHPLSISVVLPPHDCQCSLHFGIIAKGRQCALIRAAVRRNPSSGRWEVVRDWEELDWYDPEQAPGPDKFIPKIKSSLAIAIRELHAMVTGNQA